MSLPKGQSGLGFRDTESFNEALLAKQFWRLLARPNSLVARIMKEKYYKNGDLMTAGVGEAPSLIWMSINGVWDLVKAGQLWRVSNGQNIKIWYDKWLPIPSSYMVQSSIKILHREDTVDKLLEASGRWQSELIDEIFS